MRIKIYVVKEENEDRNQFSMYPTFMFRKPESDAERGRPSVSKPISNVKKSMQWSSDSESEVSSIGSDNENEAVVSDNEAPDYDSNTSVQSLLIELRRTGRCNLIKVTVTRTSVIYNLFI